MTKSKSKNNTGKPRKSIRKKSKSSIDKTIEKAVKQASKDMIWDEIKQIATEEGFSIKGRKREIMRNYKNCY